MDELTLSDSVVVFSDIFCVVVSFEIVGGTFVDKIRFLAVVIPSVFGPAPLFIRLLSWISVLTGSSIIIIVNKANL